jgi:CubicO group peptidase (beta-lactamase class C family)
MHDGRVAGRCDPRFRAVGEAFASNFAAGLEVGAACTVVLDGDVVVDLWGGTTTPGGEPWREDTLVEIRSATKGVAALAVHMLCDRGVVDLDATVASYWPELRCEATVRHALGHAAGIPVIDAPLSSGALVDWPQMCDAIAAQAPLWDPGTKVGYHGVTFGWLTGEVVRRTAGVSIGAFVREEIARPLGVDFFLGTPTSEHHRIAPMVASPRSTSAASPAAPTGDDLASRMFAPMYPPISPAWNSPEFWRAEIPVANGICTARALAGIYAELARGGGVLASSEAVAYMGALVYDGRDAVLGMPVRRTLGFELRPPWANDRRSDCAFGHAGAGGFLAFADPAAGAAFAYVKNAGPAAVGRPDPRAGALVDAMYDCLEAG